MHAPIDDQALDQLFRAARTRNGWSPEQVSEVLMRAVYDLAKMGPDFGQHLARAVRVRGVPSRQSASAAARLRRKQDKDGSGPGVCDHRPRPRLRAAAPKLFPHEPTAASWFAAPAARDVAAFRNGTLQGAYLMMAGPGARPRLRTR
jgi:hypothetical protein